MIKSHQLRTQLGIENFSRLDLVLSGLLAVLLIGGLVGGAYTYHTARSFVAQSQLPIFPEANAAAELFPTVPDASSQPDTAAVVEEDTTTTAPVAGSESTDPDAQATAEAAAPGIVAEGEGLAQDEPVAVPAATEPLTILVMGIDKRESEEGPWRTDSMILIRIDPVNNTVAMLSTPRDLYVTIPDYGYGERLDKINTAFFYGDANDYPGGGAALAKETIRQNFGIEVDRHIVMDFNGFRQIIDYIGGVEVDVPELLVDNQYPTEDYGYMTVRFEAGRQMLDGERALIYSRTRKSTSDFARAERQQEVIMAVRDKVLSLDIIPSLTPANVTRLIQSANESIRTDLTLDETLAFAQVAQGIESGDIHRAVIDNTMVEASYTNQGAEVLVPQWDEVMEVVEETFGMDFQIRGNRLTLSDTQSQPSSNDATDGPARVEVYNGTLVHRLEEEVGGELQQDGFNVTYMGTAQRQDYEVSRILIYNEAMEEEAYALQERLGLSPDTVRFVDDEYDTDIVIILGTDVAEEFGG
jgi:LCP family protein required for cell wall assembly